MATNENEKNMNQELNDEDLDKVAGGAIDWDALAKLEDATRRPSITTPKDGGTKFGTPVMPVGGGKTYTK